MKKTIEEHAERFSSIAADYDESQDSAEYRACANLVVEHAAPTEEDVVLDLGAGTGAIALRLAPAAKRVVGRDISEGMLEQARTKAAETGITNAEFGEGRFRDPNYDGDVDIVTSNFAMHHLSDEEKREAIAVIADLDHEGFVLTAVERVHDQVGVLVAERFGEAGERIPVDE